MAKRFKIALSFPGEHRAYIEEVAGHLSFALGKENVFYDNYYEEELARPNLDIYLMNIYKDHSELIAFFLCENYASKEWCGLEWRSIRDMIKHKQDDELMPFRFDKFPVDGMLSIDGYKDVQKLTPKETSELILKRHRRIANIEKARTDEKLDKLQTLEKEILDLKTNKETPETDNQITVITAEKEELRKQLLQKDDLIAQQEATRKELEKSLAAEQENEELKKKALEAVEQKNYDKAETLLIEAAQERMQKVAEDFYQLGKVKELKLEYTEALKYYELAAKIPPLNSGYLTKAGEICGTFGMLDKALDYHSKSLSINLERWGELHEGTAWDYNALGLIWQEKGNLDKAIDYYQKSLVIDLQLFGNTYPHVAVLYNNLGLAWQNKGDPNKAIEYYQKALDIDLQLFGEQNLSTTIDYNNLGGAWQNKGDFDKAIDYYQKALDIDLQLFGEANPHIAIRYNNLGEVLRNKGNFDKAINYFQKALDIDLQLYNETSPKVAIRYNNLGAAFAGKGDIDKAIDYYQKALNISLKLFGEINPKVAIRYNNLGLAWDGKGNKDKALRLVKKAHEIFLELFGPDNPSTKTVKKNLDRLLAEKNNAPNS